MDRRTTDGLLLVDKPAGMTSHDVVATVRRAFDEPRVGHAGTLDPFATGLLVLLLGRGTRLIPYLDAEPKRYEATVRFGAETATDDCSGAVVREAAIPDPAAVDAALASLTGSVEQVPPAYSAKQVGGVRAYAAARRGAPLDLKPVGVRVHEWQVLGWRGADLDVRVSCAGGTYVRALARDLGRAAGSAAHLVALRRTQSGQFDVRDAVALGALDAAGGAVRPLLDAVPHLPVQALDAPEAELASHGRSVPARVEGERVALLEEDALLAVGVRDGDRWQPRVVLRGG
ncbi:MAG TPA: tRNA pseudouridine(55) synthase TruB [Gemmatimonadaceae bacterium]|nr:tRNA pseudouridine(55) synthase TruB [Gemmatimonadaceae bacterium]